MRLFYLCGTDEATIRELFRMVEDLSCEGARMVALQEMMTCSQSDLVSALRRARIPDPEWSEVIRAAGDRARSRALRHERRAWRLATPAIYGG